MTNLRNPVTAKSDASLPHRQIQCYKITPTPLSSLLSPISTQNPFSPADLSHSITSSSSQMEDESSSSSFNEDDLFEPISLRDLHIPSPDLAPPDVSPVGSPEIPPEVVHLVDSAIMGRSDCLEKLKAMASGATSLNVSRFVVDALLVTMGGVEGLDEMDGNGFEDLTPRVMLSSRAAVVAAGLIPWLNCEGDSESCVSPRTRLVKGLFLILNSCARNRAMCSSNGLLGFLLDSAEKVVADRVWNAWPLFYCIQVLGGHSLSVMDLERWLNLIRKGVLTEWAVPLMLCLENAVGSEEAHGPANTFEFDGQNSGLLVKGDNRWPFSNGYSFVTWVYLELLEDVSIDHSTITPCMFSFVSADNQYVEAYFYGQFLVMEIGAGKGKKILTRFSYEFKPQCWYFIGIEHIYKQSLLAKAESEVRLYVDGKLQEARPFELVRTSKQLSFCCIGTNSPSTLPGLQQCRSHCPLFAEMGPVYVFKEAIGDDIMARLASRGGDALPSFGKGAGLPWLAVNAQVRSLAEESFALDADIGGSLHLFYHPCLLSGRFCPDTSPSVAAGWLSFRVSLVLLLQTCLLPSYLTIFFVYEGLSSTAFLFALM